MVLRRCIVEENSFWVGAKRSDKPCPERDKLCSNCVQRAGGQAVDFEPANDSTSSAQPDKQHGHVSRPRRSLGLPRVEVGSNADGSGLVVVWAVFECCWSRV